MTTKAKKSPAPSVKKYTLAELLPQIGEMPIIHPTLGELNCKVRLQGMHVPSVRAKALEAVSWLQAANKQQTPEEMIETINKVEGVSAESAAAAIVGWTDDDTMGGGYSPDYALSLMKRPDMGWLRDQINTFVGNQKNFFRTPNPEPN